ncbi:uncharacterized protein B0T15DRAFT_552149 [Chaetomium strumarium]|uniref:Uncharacterized protein n=1 Tax=Chaetomium strumarium TaxID=1170767 RepID=A0AAJ0M2A4_9PEZI|nr:hypothetical protein B0T15DRAFT_552149 [Chaetomium strumarium]
MASFTAPSTMGSLPRKGPPTMDSFPREVELMILRHLDDEDDRDALVAAYPSWKDSVEYDNMFTTVKVDPSGVHRMPLNDFLGLFNESNIEQHKLLHNVQVGFHLDGIRNHGWLIENEHVKEVDSWLLTQPILDVLETLHQVETRVQASMGAGASPFRLSLNNCTEPSPSCDVTNFKIVTDMWKHEMSLMFRQPLSLKLGRPMRNGPAPKMLQSVHDFVFKNKGVLRYVDPSNVVAIAWLMCNLRRLRLEFDEGEFWTAKSKENWRSSICCALAFPRLVSDGMPLLEEAHVHIGRRSVADNEDLRDRQPDSQYYRWHHAEHVIITFSRCSSLTSLKLTGQFCLSPLAFDVLPDPFRGGARPFPALRSFRLDFGPDSTGARWYFDAETPSSSSGRPFLPCLQKRTRPNDDMMNQLLLSAAKAVAKMRMIETFSLCLRDKFYFEATKRTLEVHFVSKNWRHGGCPTLTFKLGNYVDTWRPRAEVLAAWKAAAGRMERRLEILFEE